MIKTLIVGAALGYIGKKLYDEGQLDGFIDSAKSKFNEALPKGSAATADDYPIAPTVGQPLA